MSASESLDASIEVDVSGDFEDESDEKPTIVAVEGEVNIAEDESVADTLRWAADNAFERRAHLPVKHDHAASESSLWGVLKKNIGKKLSHIAMPVSFNEPLSALQRLCEELEYSSLLDEAAACADPRQRHLIVAAFAISSYGPSFYRAGRKPFNPILGETYDEVRPERGFRFCAEQVSHHPPISVCIAESPHWTFFQEAGVKSSLRPSSLKITPQGYIQVRFPMYNEVYEWKKVVSSVEDIISGNKWVDHFGKMYVTALHSGDVCKVEFQQYSRFKKSSKHAVKAGLYVPSMPKKPVFTLEGKWHDKITCVETKQVLWQNAPPPDGAVASGFGMTQYAAELNQLPPEGNDQRTCLLSSDSRLRPDQRMWENAQEEQAVQEKLRVEALQRAARKEREEAGNVWSPRFFAYRRVQVPKPVVPAGMPVQKESTREEWVYKGGYWKQKRSNSVPPIGALW